MHFNKKFFKTFFYTMTRKCSFASKNLNCSLGDYFSNFCSAKTFDFAKIFPYISRTMHCFSLSWVGKTLLIHEANPQSQLVVITIFACIYCLYVRPSRLSVPTFENLAKQKSSSENSDNYWRKWGSGRVDHCWHTSFFYRVTFFGLMMTLGDWEKKTKRKKVALSIAQILWQNCKIVLVSGILF